MLKIVIPLAIESVATELNGTNMFRIVAVALCDGVDVPAELLAALADGEYDPMTCNLLQWYIAEEEDSGRRLREAYACVREKAGRRRAMAGGEGAHASADAEAIMACMTEGFLRLEKSIEKLAKAKR